MELRPATDADLRVLAQVQAAQDTAWWGSPDGDDDDMRAELDRARMASGSLDQGSRVAVARRSDGEGEVVGFGFSLGHGQTENATALGLYRSVGLEVIREWLHCSPD